MTNDEVGSFVRQRLDTKSLSQIVAEIFDTIITRDPKRSQGIGADNMTCIIIRLNVGASQTIEASTSISSSHEVTMQGNASETISISSTIADGAATAEPNSVGSGEEASSMSA
jgi:serine/threonine protein phosphatase PrpC